MSSVRIVDLREWDAQSEAVHCDVCIVGAGAAGIYLASRLAVTNLRVMLLEAGGKLCVEGPHIGIESDFSGAVYAGATIGRAFGLGGSTSKWGGALMPYGPSDQRNLSRDSSTWTHIVGVAKARTPTVLKALGYRAKPDLMDFARCELGDRWTSLWSAGIVTSAALFLPFGARNMAPLLRKASGPAQISLFLYAVAKGWSFHRNLDRTSVECLEAVSTNGRTLRVNAAQYVIAAGAIESARILLEISQSAAVIPDGAPVGCYLGDHLSVTIADVAESERQRTAELFGPRFSGRWMRSFRFLEKAPPETSPRAFAHLIFASEAPGFRLAREVLRGMQARRLPSVTRAELTSGITDAFSLIYDRYARSALHIPVGTPTHLQLDMEQTPTRESRVSLGQSLDKHGRRRPVIQWQIDDADVEKLRETANRLLSKWPHHDSGFPRLVPREIGGNAEKPHDTYHPVGTCRMGNDADAVVDEQLKLRGVENLWIVSTAVLPSAGTANPTFTMFCLAEMLQENLARKLQSA